MRRACRRPLNLLTAMSHPHSARVLEVAALRPHERAGESPNEMAKRRAALLPLKHRKRLKGKALRRSSIIAYAFCTHLDVTFSAVLKPQNLFPKQGAIA